MDMKKNIYLFLKGLFDLTKVQVIFDNNLLYKRSYRFNDFSFYKLYRE